MVDTVLISDEDVCCSVGFSTLFGVFSVMWSELLMTSAIICPLWSSVYECQSGVCVQDSVSISSFAVLNTDSPTRLPGNADPSSPDVSLASAYLITSSEWQTHTTMSSDHLPILIGLQTTATSSPARHKTYINLKKDDWTGYRQEIERKLRSRHLPTDCQKNEKLF